MMRVGCLHQGGSATGLAEGFVQAFSSLDAFDAHFSSPSTASVPESERGMGMQRTIAIAESCRRVVGLSAWRWQHRGKTEILHVKSFWQAGIFSAACTDLATLV
jgi:hypothetical protein